MQSSEQEIQSAINMEKACAVIPLGGLGEIGKNMLLLEYCGKILVIDAGLTFPGEDQPGVDLIIPDFSYLDGRAGDILGVVLTHGHEDHIGALPYFLKKFPVPVYGTGMTLGIVSNKLDEHGLLDQIELHRVHGKDHLILGPFEIEFINVTHSIVDGVALGIKTSAGRILHTGDFKLDPTPVDGCVTDLTAFGKWGGQGVDLLLADSTNAEREGYTLSEREVGLAFDDIIRQAKGRVIIACFSSNIHRFQQIVNSALKFQRKIAVLGMSMIKNMRTAQELGYLSIPDSLWQKWNDISMLAPDKTILMTTGSQGEPKSALFRAAVGEHSELVFKNGDTVVISARTIPGNEKRIGAMINQLFKLGCHVHYERVSEIHVSGHAAREELKIIHNIVKPSYFMPVHGETRHLVHHASLAEELGMPKERIFIMSNGDQLYLTSEGVFRGNPVNAGKVLVDGKGVGDVDDVVLRDRKHLSQDGMVIVTVGVNRQTGALLSGPDVLMKGICEEPETESILQEVQSVIKEAIGQETRDALAEKNVVQDNIRRALKKFFKKKMMRFPMIIPVIMEV